MTACHMHLEHQQGWVCMCSPALPQCAAPFRWGDAGDAACGMPVQSFVPRGCASCPRATLQATLAHTHRPALLPHRCPRCPLPHTAPTCTPACTITGMAHDRQQHWQPHDERPASLPPARLHCSRRSPSGCRSGGRSCCWQPSASAPPAAWWWWAAARWGWSLRLRWRGATADPSG